MSMYYSWCILYFNLIASESMYDFITKISFMNVESVDVLASVYKKLTSIGKDEYGRVSYLQWTNAVYLWGAMYIYHVTCKGTVLWPIRKQSGCEPTIETGMLILLTT